MKTESSYYKSKTARLLLVSGAAMQDSNPHGCRVEIHVT